MNEIKYCKDCKWVNHGLFTRWEFAKCNHPKTNEDTGDLYIHPNVTGPRYAGTARKHANLCGNEGRFFEVKQ